MKKLLTCFFAIMVVAPAAFAADGAVSRVIPTGANNTNSAASDTKPTVARTTKMDTKTADANTMATSVRNAVSRVFSGTPAVPAYKSADVVARSGVLSRGVTGQSASEKLSAAVNTVGRNSRVSSASINSDPSVRRAGLTLRPSTAEVGGRAIIGDTGVQTGSNIDEAIRGLNFRAASRNEISAESIAAATEVLEQTATLNKSCQQQYNDCMDQFCAVIDANQGRCSCSANLSRYTKVEDAVKDANAQLNEVAQRIRYVGLSADEIRAIMNETEAEAELSGSVDTSETRSMLEEIEEMIRNPVSTTFYSSDTGSTSLDLDLDFTSESADLFNLDFLSNDGGSFSNLRGTELYNAAKRRCNNVLKECKEAGATSNQITGNYDLAIDKDCIAYEQGLVKMNETLRSNVRSANLMLQKARLAVLQNKNQYDAKGCIAALENCMLDDMVCGDDYLKCVDPTKRYIDENGNVVLGQRIADITDFMVDYNNANIDDKFLANAYKMTSLDVGTCKDSGSDGSCVAAYLLKKIGTKQNVTEEGLCRAVLDKCQRYTYDTDGKYESYNDVVVHYVQRAMVNIRASQHQIISDYASSCMTDIAACYNQQVTQVNAWSTSASVNSIYNIMRGACRNVALTCAYAVFYKDANSCPTDEKKTAEENEKTCIESISEMFYQSLLCPANSTYSQTELTVSKNGASAGNVNTHCKCNEGYEVWGTSCVTACPDGETRNTSTGVCQKSEN